MIHAVEMSLLQQSLGYHYEEEVASCYEGVWSTTTVKKYKHPSTEATKFFLTNSKPSKWKNRKSMEIDPSSMSDEELIKEALHLIRNVKQEENDGDEHKLGIPDSTENQTDRGQCPA